MVWRVFGVVFFFFSSRRRHTRFDCDWSSDVCSSDLEDLEGGDVHVQRVRLAAAVGHDLRSEVVADRTVLLVRRGVVEQSVAGGGQRARSEEHTSELQSQSNLVCRLLLEKKKNTNNI